MLHELTHEEFESWVNFYQVDPWGEVRADMRMARMCWAVQQIHTKRKIAESVYRLQFLPAPDVTPEAFRRKLDTKMQRLAKKLR